MSDFFRVYPGTIISRLPYPLKILALSARYIFKFISREQKVKKESDHYFFGEGITTSHNSNFMTDVKFKSAYKNAVEAVGWDFEIPWRVHLILWTLEMSRNISGDMVELGTGRGFMARAMLSYKSDLFGKSLFLCDTFKPYFPDSKTGIQSEINGVSEHYAVNFLETKKHFSEFNNVQFIEGELPNSILGRFEKISFLHIDLNHHLAEISSLKYLWKFISIGAPIILDDYANRGHEQQYEAMNRLAEELDISILTLPTGQGLIIK